MPPLALRPHHLLCVLGFQGKGYSDAFTANMAQIVLGQLRAAQSDDVQLVITTQADAICGPCPKRVGVGCKSQSQIDALDQRHMQALEIAPGQELSWGAAKARIKARLRPADLRRLCQGCQWLELGLCETGLENLLKEKAAPEGAA
ncbi:MAG: DUF1284 domain-containing protein [Mangrovicoccus sp.]